MSTEPKRVGLTEAEAGLLDIGGMFPTQFGWEHPDEWEKRTVRDIGAKVGRIVASRVARIVSQGYVTATEAAAREAAARREAEDDPKHALMYRALMERAEKAEAAVAAARREALLEREQSASTSMDATMGMWREQCARAEKAEETLALVDNQAGRLQALGEELEHRALAAEAKVARVEALAEAWRDQDWSGRDTAAPFARAIENALAEPEGGR